MKSVSQSASKVSQSVSQPANQLPTSQSANQPVSQLTNHPISQPVWQSIIQSVSQSASQTPTRVFANNSIAATFQIDHKWGGSASILSRWAHERLCGMKLVLCKQLSIVSIDCRCFARVAPKHKDILLYRCRPLISCGLSLVKASCFPLLLLSYCRKWWSVLNVLNIVFFGVCLVNMKIIKGKKFNTAKFIKSLFQLIFRLHSSALVTRSNFSWQQTCFHENTHNGERRNLWLTTSWSWSFQTSMPIMKWSINNCKSSPYHTATHWLIHCESVNNTIYPTTQPRRFPNSLTEDFFFIQGCFTRTPNQNSDLRVGIEVIAI